MNNDKRLLVARKLVTALELDDHLVVEQLLDELGLMQKTKLFQEIGKLTRQLHDVLSISVIDPRLSDLASSSMPDAQERLKHVLSLTEQSTHQTLMIIERLLPLVDQSKTSVQGINDALQGNSQTLPFISSSAYPELMQPIQTLIGDIDSIHQGLQDILMAQCYQDITGQIICKVIDAVHNIEESMVSIVRNNGGDAQLLNGPNVPGVDDKVGYVAGDQNDVDDLLSSLGF